MGNAARQPIVIIQNELHEATSIKAATLSGSERVATIARLIYTEFGVMRLNWSQRGDKSKLMIIVDLPI